MKTRILIIGLLILALLRASVLLTFAGGEEFSFQVIADTHFVPAANCASVGDIQNLPGNAMYSHATSQGQMNTESEALLMEMLDEFRMSGQEILLIAGDLTNGKRASHTAFAEILREFCLETGKTVYVICGNHDVQKQNDDGQSVTIDEFKTIYNDFGYKEAINVDVNSGSYVVELGADLRLLAIDSCNLGEDNGIITQSLYSWIQEQAQAARDCGKKLIAMMHHSAVRHFAVQEVIEVENGDFDSFGAFLADEGIKYVFTGHIHGNDISAYKSRSGNTVFDVMTGSLITSPNSFRTVSVFTDRVEIATDYITNVDPSYLPVGYTDEQLSLIESDFPAYSSGFFKAGMEYWLMRNIGSANKVARMLDIEPGTPAYGALEKIMGRLGDALALPVYETGETTQEYDSLEEIALSFGETIPQSDYEKISDIVADVAANFYKGAPYEEESSLAVDVLLPSIKGALAYILGDFTGTKGFEDLISVITSLDGSIPIPVTNSNAALQAANTVLKSVIMPLLDGIATDYAQPDDLDVTLEGYGLDWSIPSAPASLILRILRFFEIMIRTLSKGMVY